MPEYFQVSGNTDFKTCECKEFQEYVSMVRIDTFPPSQAMFYKIQCIKILDLRNSRLYVILNGT